MESVLIPLCKGESVIFKPVKVKLRSFSNALKAI